MKKFAAHWIFPIITPPIPYGIITTDDEGTILEIRETGGKPVEESNLEFYSGILIPGMVNAHCHLELSHLKGKIHRNLGLSGFVGEINRERHTDIDQIQAAAKAWDRIMWHHGIVAVGDISNTTHTLPVKQKSPIRYHTFVELFNLIPEQASQVVEKGLRITEEYRSAGLEATLTPHAPYSLTVALWEALSRSVGETCLISIHHDESREERELLDKREGPLADRFKGLGYDLAHLPPEAGDINRLLSKYLPRQEYLLVHNTYSNPGTPIGPPNSALCLCPRANLYIENRLPDIPGMASTESLICLGSDSLASNDSLSILDEIRVIQQAFPQIGFQELLRWATLNGAKVLGFEQQMGSFTPGKKPGVVHVNWLDWENGKLGEESLAVRLI